MCTYDTVTLEVTGSAKGPGGQWFKVSDATVYFDHPVHAMAGHTLNIDFLDPSGGPGRRIGLELTAESGAALAEAIRQALAAVPPEILADT